MDSVNGFSSGRTRNKTLHGGARSGPSAARGNCARTGLDKEPPQGLNHFLPAAREAAAEVIVLDPLYSTHDQDENDTRAMASDQNGDLNRLLKSFADLR